MSLDSLLGSGALAAEKRALLEKMLAEQGIKRSQEPVIPKRDPDAPLELSFAQQSLWVVDQLEGGAHYNDYLALRLSGQLNVAALEASINAIVARHEALRTTFAKREGRPVQVIALICTCRSASSKWAMAARSMPTSARRRRAKWPPPKSDSPLTLPTVRFCG
ncbi:MAG: hypothetical protein HC802_12170 [Caldilineaceae bacterium]|nr:hypothetical protein [Caldilineaceae bacterium]